MLSANARDILLSLCKTGDVDGISQFFQTHPNDTLHNALEVVAMADNPVALKYVLSLSHSAASLCPVWSGRDLTSALCTAATIGNLENVKLLVDSGKINLKEASSCINFAAKNGHIQVVKFLAENGAKLKRNFFLNSVLSHAITNNRLDIVEYLVKSCGISPEESDAKGWNAINFSAVYGFISSLKFFYSQGYNVVNCKILCESKGSKALAQFFLSKGGWNSLKHSQQCSNGNCANLDGIKKHCQNFIGFLESGMPVSPHDLQKLTFSKEWGYVFKFLLKTQKEETEIYVRNFKDSEKTTFLHILAGRISEEDLKILVNYFSINEVDASNNTILHKISPTVNLLSVLLEKKPNLNIQDFNFQRTPLMKYIVEKPSEILEIATMLMKAGADINLKDALGATVVHYAIESGDIELMKVVLNFHKQQQKALQLSSKVTLPSVSFNFSVLISPYKYTNFFSTILQKRLESIQIFQAMLDCGYKLDFNSPKKMDVAKNTLDSNSDSDSEDTSKQIVSKSQGEPPVLYVYFYFSYPDIAFTKFLMDKGIDIRASYSGDSCLGFLLEKKLFPIEFVKFFITYGNFLPDEIVDDRGNTLVHKLMTHENLLCWAADSMPAKGTLTEIFY